MTAEELRSQYDWTNTKPDMRDRVVRAIESQFDLIVACTGRPKELITWANWGYEYPLDAGNFAFRDSSYLQDDVESVLAIRKQEIGA